MHLKVEVAPMFVIELFLTQPTKAWAMAADESGRAFVYFSEQGAKAALLDHRFFGRKPEDTRVRRMRKDEMVKDPLVT